MSACRIFSNCYSSLETDFELSCYSVWIKRNLYTFSFELSTQQRQRFYCAHQKLHQIPAKNISRDRRASIQTRLYLKSRRPQCNLISCQSSKFFMNLQVVCDVLFSVKPISNKPALRWTDVYSVEPQRAAVQPHSFAYVTITFQPPSMQVRSHGTQSLVNINIICINAVTSVLRGVVEFFYSCLLYAMLLISPRQLYNLTNATACKTKPTLLCCKMEMIILLSIHYLQHHIRCQFSENIGLIVFETLISVNECLKRILDDRINCTLKFSKVCNSFTLIFKLLFCSDVKQGSS